MEQQEYLLKLQMLEQQANQFGEQLNVINQQISELTMLKSNLLHLDKSKEKEIYSEFGKGIFIKAKLDSKDFLVDVGNKIYVPKNFNEISKIIDEQIDKFEEIKPEIAKRVEQVNKQLNSLIEQARKEKGGDKTKKVEKSKEVKGKRK
ncbi:prefoldin subunit alpha [Candidatus Pacearchaeota archaeon]|nr:prefoldin subunit alpha [Candidatus Pacearchaeota archaeon]